MLICAAMNRTELIDRLYQEKRAAGSWKELARLIGISQSYLSDIVNYRRDPGKRVLDHLGVCVKVQYVPSQNLTERSKRNGARNRKTVK